MPTILLLIVSNFFMTTARQEQLEHRHLQHRGPGA